MKSECLESEGEKSLPQNGVNYVSLLNYKVY